MEHVPYSSGMALLGCDVVSTDQTEVLPLLMRNAERNTSRILQTLPDPGTQPFAFEIHYYHYVCTISM